MKKIVSLRRTADNCYYLYIPKDMIKELHWQDINSIKLETIEQVHLQDGIYKFKMYLEIKELDIDNPKHSGRNYPLGALDPKDKK